MARSVLELKKEERLFVLIADAAMQAGEYGDDLKSAVGSLMVRYFNWQRFMKLASYHHYPAAVARFFTDLDMLNDLPDGIREVLENEYILSQARFLKKEHELLDIVVKLEERRIEPIVMKGIPLAYLLYRDCGVRVLKDIDILIRPSELESAAQILREQGYSTYTGPHSLEEYRRHHFHYVFGRGENVDSVIELHWDLVHPITAYGHIDRDELAAAAIPVRVGGGIVRTLSLPHALWHLGLHASQKSFLSFRSLVEMKGIAGRLDESGWDCVFAWLSRCRMDREFKLALSLCESLYGRFLDARIERRLKPGHAARIFILSMYYPRALVWEWMPFAATHELAMLLYLKKGLAAKLKYLYHLVFPDQATLFGLYFDYRRGGLYDRMRFHLNGLTVLLKVILLTPAMGFLVRSGLVGRERLDPERNAGG